jgi:hypothetical protein
MLRVFTVFGLPAHPLIVHAVVVLIPLAALGAVAVAARPIWNRPYGPLVAAGALAGAFCATVAMLAGNELAASIHISPEYEALISEHGRSGVWTVGVGWVFAVLAIASAVLGRRDREGANRSALPRVLGWVSAVVGIIALAVVVRTGDLGATSVWGTVSG